MNNNSLDQFARLLREQQVGVQKSNSLMNRAQATYGEIVDVNDPEQRGRIKVVIDEVNPKLHSEQGFTDNGEPTKSDWIDPKVPFKGLQPEKLVGLRVPVEPKQGDPNRLFFGSPVNDQGESSTSAPPENSDMVRLPVYPMGSLPSADGENIGCMVIEQGGPMQSDWLCVCLSRNGQYMWVRHIDLAHGHAGEDDGDQKPDSDGDGEDPVKELTVWDYVFPTTHEEYSKNSKHGTDPRDNPYGGEAKHYGGA